MAHSHFRHLLYVAAHKGLLLRRKHRTQVPKARLEVVVGTHSGSQRLRLEPADQDTAVASSQVEVGTGLFEDSILVVCWQRTGQQLVALEQHNHED